METVTMPAKLRLQPSIEDGYRWTVIDDATDRCLLMIAESPEADSLATLVLAAPDLLEALIGLLAVHDRLVPGDPILDTVYGTGEAARLARAAIAKAAPPGVS